MEFRINRKLDLAAFAKTYAEQGIVQITNLFDEDTADHIEATLLSLPWRLVSQNDEKRNVMFSAEQLRAMSSAERAELEAGIRKRAAENFGYAYLTYPMIQAAMSRWDRDHPIHQITMLLNSPSFIAIAREIINCPDVVKVDAQASNYRPGNFLTRHVDDGQKLERRAAYTIGFSRRWEPDWGGLLMFVDDNKDISRAYLPRFNTLTVFDGLRLHSVSAVSAFAPVPRLSVVGWFRDDAPAYFTA
ncbi:MAG: 2OG-Fe(II) oxygenase [Alphaproteobacteria bacterium]|nr:2OG-Fe(II) oxygenase [Alphaproteobacteria bacterium]